MKAVVLREGMTLSNARLSMVDEPEPQTGEVVVKLHAAALNHRDLFIFQGRYAGLRYPIIPGADGVGEIASLGMGVSGFSIGDRVIINPSLEWGNDPAVQGPRWRILGLPDNGTFAEYVAVPASAIAPWPTGLDAATAAALPLAGLTAYRAVVTRGALRAGERVLVLGIGGGVATFALLIARQLGARILVTSGSEEKIARARDLGAEAGFSYRDESWVTTVREAFEGGPDLVIDGTGGEVFNLALDVVRPGGRVVSYGATLGATPELLVRRIFWKQLSVLGSTMGSPDDFKGLLACVSQGLHPVVDSIYPLADASQALEHMENASQFGKIVLQIV